MTEPDRSWRKVWTAPALSGAAATVLYLSGLFSFLFAVPLQLVYERSGKREAVYGTGVGLVLIALTRLVQTARVTTLSGDMMPLLAMDIMIPAGIMIGLLAFNLVRQLTWSLRLVGAGLIGIVGAIPLIVTFGGDSELNQVLQQELVPMLESMGMVVDGSLLLEQVRRLLLSTIGLAMTSSIAANWWIGKQLSFRSALRLRSAIVDDRLVWLVIGGLGLVVLGWIGSSAQGMSIAVARYVGWNATAIGAFVFAIQGVGVIEHFLVRKGASRRSLRWTLMIVVLALFLPGINVAVIVGVPALGISEIWIDYKRRTVNESNT